MPWKSKTERQAFWWRAIVDKESARKAAMDGFGAAMFVAGVTALIAALDYFGVKIFPDMSLWNLVDVVIFAFIGWRIRAMSRIWAVLGLLMYLGEAGYGLYIRGLSHFGAIIMVVVLVMAFINGVRGTFAFHKYSLAAQTIGTIPSTPPPPL